MPNLDDIISALGSGAVTRARENYQQAADSLLQDLKVKGVYATPSALNQYISRRDDQLMKNLADVLSKLDFDAYTLGVQQDQYDKNLNWNRQLLAHQQHASQRQLDLAERQQTLSELVTNAYMEAVRRQAADWLTPIGQALSTVFGQSLGNMLGIWGYKNLSKLFGDISPTITIPKTTTTPTGSK